MQSWPRRSRCCELGRTSLNSDSAAVSRSRLCALCLRCCSYHEIFSKHLHYRTRYRTHVRNELILLLFKVAKRARACSADP